MSFSHSLRASAATFAIALAPFSVRAQGTAADDARFVYRKSVRGGAAFVLVDAATREKRPAFNHDRLAASIASAIRRPSVTGTSLPLGRLAFVDSARAIEFTLTARPGETVTDTTRWRCTLADYVCGRAAVRADS